ncbi:MAG: polysaccharide pyruvyl transferase family protein [Pseudomonadota bacterium]|nr:polysaccharide pyruvyl transferase family protein [Pseudomonadota bacterium]
MRVGLLAPSRRYEDCFLNTSEALFRASGDNLGNFAFIEALWRHLQPDVTILPWHVTVAEARATCDILVLAAANQLGSHNDLGGFASHLEAIGLPIVVVGLGAQAPNMAAGVQINAGTERWARTLAALAPGLKPNIGVRGEFTRRALEKLGLGDRAVVTGCPSNFLNDRADFYPLLKRNLERRRIDRLCVAAGNPNFVGTRELERRLVSLVEATGGLYVVQADLEMVRFARGESARSGAAEAEAIRQFLAPERTPAALQLWRQRHAAAFADATSWLEAMRAFDFVVGARFHGVMLGLQAGAPGGVLAHDSRTLEMCQTMGVPVRLINEIGADFALADLHAMFPLDIAAYASTRERLRRVYVDLLRGCGIEPHPRLTTLQALPA